MKAPSTNRRRKRLAVDDSPEAVAARLRAASAQIRKWANDAIKVKAPPEGEYVVFAGPTRANAGWKIEKTAVADRVTVYAITSDMKVKKASGQDPTSKPRYKKAVASLAKVK